MLQLLAFGAAVGAGFQAWRNYPPDGPVAGDMLAVVFIAGVLAAYLGGRWRGRHGSRSTATATATAEAVASANAQQAVQVFISNGPGEGARPVGYSLPSSAAPWLATADERPALTLDQVDGMDLAELVEDHERDGAA